MKHSRREYVVQTSTGNTITEFLQPSIQDILEEQSAETYFALQEEIDSVLDLKVNESMYFQPNRDNKETKGIITRVR